MKVDENGSFYGACEKFYFRKATCMLTKRDRVETVQIGDFENITCIFLPFWGKDEANIHVVLIEKESDMFFRPDMIDVYMWKSIKICFHMLMFQKYTCGI